MNIPELIIHGTLYQRAEALCGLLLAGLLVYLYLRTGKKRWKMILNESLSYHRFHLAVISREKTASDKTREIARAMLWALDKQYPQDCREGLGFRTFLRAYMGIKNSLLIMTEVFFQVARNHYMMDERIPRLMITLQSTFSRLAILESRFILIALPYMDLFLFLSIIGIARSGKSRLYRDIRKKL